MSKQQIQIVVESDAEKLAFAEMLNDVAEEFGLFDNTDDSRVADTIASFSEGEYYGFGVGARRIGKLIVLDFNLAKGDSQKLKKIYEALVKRTKDMFGARAAVMGTDQFIPIVCSLPKTDDMRRRQTQYLLRKRKK